MTKSDFLRNIATRFPRITAENLADIGEYVSTISEDNLGRLWTVFETKYTLVSPPRKIHVENIATDAGVFPAGHQERRMEYVCGVCGCRYPLASTQCPRCMNRDRTWQTAIQVGAQYTGRLKGDLEREKAELASGLVSE